MSEIEDAIEASDELAPLTDAIAATLPSGWKLETLGSLCEKSQYGWTTKADKDGQGVKFLRTTDITPGVVDWERVPYCVEAPPDLDKYLIREGDLLISRTGSIGVNYLVSNPESAVFASYLIRFRPKKSISTKYLRYYLQSPAYWRAIAAGKKGIAVQNVNATMLSKIPVPVAPETAQQEIVAEIEKQFSRLDEAVANLKRVKANLKRYKASVLKDAVEGRLVPTEAELARREGRSFETGEQLLQRVLEIRSSQWKSKGKYKAPIAADPTDLTKLPEGWTWASLDQLTSKITSGSRDWSQYYGRGTGIFVLAQNVRPFTPDFSAQQFVDPPSSDPSCDRSRIQDGDLLATIVGANAGQICLVAKAPIDAYVCQSVALIRPVFPGTAAHLNYWLNSAENGQRYLDQCMYGQGRPHLSFEQLMAAPIALPPVTEQQRIVAEVDRRLSLVREVEAEVDANLKRAQSLRQSTLSKAFATNH